MQASLNSFQISVVDYDIKLLGEAIMSQIKDVGKLHLISIGDLKVYGSLDGKPPTDVKSAINHGTKFFDALLYFSLESTRRPALLKSEKVLDNLPEEIMRVKKHLLWMAIFLMLRGSYPSDEEKKTGTNIPAFLKNICGMNVSPKELATSLASFELKNLDPRWIIEIDWRGFAPEIRQRLALGLSGYRMLSPFACYEVQENAPKEAKEAVDFLKKILAKKPDYAILSCTRSAEIVSRFKSWNKSLGNLMLICYTEEQIDEMVTNKIIFVKPTRDPRADTWRAWVGGEELKLETPVKI